MIVRYDDFNRLQPPELTLCDPGCYAREDGDGQVRLSAAVGRVFPVQDLTCTYNFGEASELSFTAERPASGGFSSLGGDDYAVIRKLAVKRYLYLQGFGFFVIYAVTRQREGEKWVYSVSARSCEAELEGWTLPYFEDGTRPLHQSGGEEGVLDLLVKDIPHWQVGDIDPVLLYKNPDDPSSAPIVRNFEGIGESAKSIYDFLMDDVQTAFNCILLFDPILRRIHAYSPLTYQAQHTTDIRLDHVCLADSLSVEESCEELCTALHVQGENGMGIEEVNPTGTGILYNFEAVSDRMSFDLADAVLQWQMRYNSSLDEYQRLHRELYGDTGSGEDNPGERIDEIQKSLSFSSAGGLFSDEELEELKFFLYEQEYTDEYALITDDMTYAQKQEQYAEMMERARAHLQKASHPSTQFSVGAESFLFSQSFAGYSEQLVSGCSISVETDDDVFQDLYLTSYEVNYSQKSLQLTFGDAYQKFDLRSVFHQVFPKKSLA